MGQANYRFFLVALAVLGCLSGTAVAQTEEPAEEQAYSEDAHAEEEYAAEAEEPYEPQIAMRALTGEAARYWPRWRGPSGQGNVADGYEYPESWSEYENILWKVEVPGYDAASPIVWGDRIFVSTTHRNGQRSLLCYRRSDGQRLWQTFAPDVKVRSTQRKSSSAISTPTTDGKRVYVFFGSHGLAAYDFDGKQLWHQPLGGFDHATSSPLLYDDKVIVVQVDPTRRGSYIAALKAETGSARWTTYIGGKYACGTPVAIEVEGQDQIVVSSYRQAVALNPGSGKMVWKLRGNANQAIPTPVVGYGLVFLTSGRAGPTIAGFPTGQGNVTDTLVAWRVEQWAPYIPSPLFYDGYLYVLNDSVSVLTCFDAADGRIAWQDRLGPERRGGFVSSPVEVNGKLFYTDITGKTFVVASGPEFKLLGTNDLREAVRASPALVEGVWYFRTDRNLVAVGHSGE
jgi:outer membrane protein assembly factor BamB